MWTTQMIPLPSRGIRLGHGHRRSSQPRGRTVRGNACWKMHMMWVGTSRASSLGSRRRHHGAKVDVAAKRMEMV
jgi:hypothetical protein